MLTRPCADVLQHGRRTTPWFVFRPTRMFVEASLAVVLAVGLFLACLGLVSLLHPRLARRFLGGFAGSAMKHYLELGLRAMVGLAFIDAAPCLPMPALHHVVGWVLIATTAVLAALPWRWHHRFAQWSVPRAVAHLPLIGMASLVVGGAVVASAWFAVTC